jgi:hypothetical protein
MTRRSVAMGWADFYALVDGRDLEGMEETDPESARGEFPDAMWLHGGDPVQAGRNMLAQLERMTGKPVLQVFAAFPWWWERCRIEARPTGLVAVMPGLRDPVSINPALVFRGSTYMKELERRAGPPVMPALPPGAVVTESTAFGSPARVLPIIDPHAMANDPEYAKWLGERIAAMRTDEGKAAAAADAERTKRRDLSNIDMLEELLAAAQGLEPRPAPPVPTAASSEAVMGSLRRRVTDEAKRVKRFPGVMERLATVLALPPDTRRRQASQTAKAVEHREDQSKRMKGRMQVCVQLTPESRVDVLEQPNRKRQVLALRMTAPLPYEVRQISLDAETDPEQKLRRVADECIDTIAGMNPDLHRSMMAVTAELQDNQRLTVTPTSLYAMRGGQGMPTPDIRRRMAHHIDLMRRLEFDITEPDNEAVVTVLPFIGTGMRQVERVGRQPLRVNFLMHQESVVGMLNRAAKTDFLADKRLLEPGLDDFTYTLGVYLSRQWSARATQHAVQGKRQHAYRLETVLGHTAGMKWREKLRKEGRKWLEKRVEAALADLNARGLYGLGGTAWVEWNPTDILASMFHFGDPPPHITEAHMARNSRRIEGAKAKAKRLREGAKAKGRR